QRLRTELIRDGEVDVEVYHDLAMTSCNLGVAWAAKGRDADAERCYRDAAERWDRLIALYPGETRYRVFRAKPLHDLANLWENQGRYADALKLGRELIKANQKTAQENPTDSEVRADLARSYLLCGDLLSLLGGADEALGLLGRGLALCDEQVRANPAVHEW